MKRDELLSFIKNKISSEDYDKLFLQTKKLSKRLFFLNSNFDCELKGGFFKIKYISTGAYLGDGFIYEVYLKRIEE